ncbi:MAG: glycosyltransferase [Arenicellales bacterium]
MRTINVIQGQGGIAAGLLHPLIRRSFALEGDYGFRIRCIPTGGLLEGAGVLDTILVQGRGDSQPIRATLTALRERNPAARLVYWDTHASTYARNFDLLDAVDVYVRRNLFRDMTLHEASYRGGRIFAEFFVDYLDLREEWCGTVTLDPRYRDKIVLGWDIAGQDYIERALERSQSERHDARARPIDVCCRIGINPNHSKWYVGHRRAVLQRLQSLDGFVVVATDQKLPKTAYLEELESSKIVVSPFGWGEVCWRDFEAVACGCLLVKPSMEHVATYPFYYRDRETYVSVRWDLEDLGDKIRYYLAHDRERRCIVRNATEALAQYFRDETYARKLAEIIDVPGGGAP